MVLGAGGCAKHGADAIKEMRARACAGDAVGFLNQIDRKEFTRSTRAAWERSFEASIAKLDAAAQVAEREKFRKGIDSAVQTKVSDTFQVWEYDIKTHGPQSEVCRLSIIESSEVGNTADVHVTTPATGDRQWRMARSGDRWLLVRVGD
jgi:hypothetical protein